MLYLTCITISSVDLAHYGVSRTKDWVSVLGLCCKFFFQLPQAEIRQRNITVDSNLIIGLVGSINIEIAGNKF